MNRLVNAVSHSLAGLKSVFASEAAFRQETVLFMVLAPLAMWLGRDHEERALLILSLMLVLIVELLNSGIEAVIDRIGLEIHPLSKKAKDIGSAAVFLSLLNAIFIWGLVLT